MASTYERKTDGQIIYGPNQVLNLPDIDLVTLIFESEICRIPEDTVLFADAEDPSHNLTKAKLRQSSKQLAHVLRDQYGTGASGPGKDVVFNISTGHYMTPVIFYAVIIADGIFASTNPAATPDEVAYQLRQTDSRVIMCTPDMKEKALEAAKKVGLLPRNVLIYDGLKALELREATSGAEVPISKMELDWRRITDPVELENSVICLLFSSGTTGLPKAMRISHRNTVASCSLMSHQSKMYFAKTKPPSYRCYLLGNCYLGGICYWMKRFDLQKFSEYGKKYKVTNLMSVPPIFILIAKSPLIKDHFDTCDDALSGAAPMGEDLQLEVSKKIGKGAAILRQTWGLSETTGSITITPAELAHIAPAGSVGSLIANCYARLVDDNERDVEPGQAGEIWVRGPVVTKGYWKNDQASQDSFRDGWFCTGDIGVVRDGFFFIVDRKKELIKYKGNQVAPAELEAVLLSHPKILDAAVIGVPGEDTEVPRAYVVANRKEISGPEIVEWFEKQGLSHYKRLRGGIVFLDAIPRSASGKILRNKLRELVKKERLTAKI